LRAGAFAVKIGLGLRRIGRAGRGATPTGLGRALGVPRFEANPLALLGALLSAKC
jgi:hypothetical protein